MDEGNRYTKELHEAYTKLKMVGDALMIAQKKSSTILLKAKEAYDEINRQHQDAKEQLLKAQRSPNVKEKELEKVRPGR